MQMFLFLGCALFLQSCTSSTKSMDVKGRFLSQKKEWSGKYVQTNGLHDLYIDQWDPEGIFATIVRSGQSPEDRENATAFFVAKLNGNLATWISDPECRIQLERMDGGVSVSDFCRGAESESQSGVYKLVR